ncbi:MAG: hypothetical protein LQ347_003659 [Umbilicaria vellea]|nr:MAG: hypothetical protein LQ347_003659 [Umbilicaria vellea]
MVVWLAGPDRVRVEEEVYRQVVDCHSPNATAAQIEDLMSKLSYRSPGLKVIVAVMADIGYNCTGTYGGVKRK